MMTTEPNKKQTLPAPPTYLNMRHNSVALWIFLISRTYENAYLSIAFFHCFRWRFRFVFLWQLFLLGTHITVLSDYWLAEEGFKTWLSTLTYRILQLLMKYLEPLHASFKRLFTKVLLTDEERPKSNFVQCIFVELELNLLVYKWMFK
jgi:hypothetical protein